MIVWNAALATGVPNIDAQHQELIEHFNALAAAVEQGRGREETGALLDFLQFYALWHFEREEHCMDEYRCPAAAANKAAHHYFKRRFGWLYEQYQESDANPQTVSDTLAELETWIVSHIARIDTRLGPCVNGSTAGA